MHENATQKLSQLPPDYKTELLPAIREEFIQSKKTIVVLDDDPTGTQTCYDVTVLTAWHVTLITEELRKKPSILYILTNSRSLPEQEAVELTLEIGNNVNKAAQESGRQIVVISRSDSTLRGHFPAEVDAIARTMDIQNAVVVLIPAFIEGGRLTLEDIHYVVENQALVPVSDTPFASDVVFGYKHADLKLWVEEKTKGRIRAEDVSSISLEDIRIGGPHRVREKLKSCAAGTVCIVNATSYRDLEVVVMGLMLAEKQGKTFLYRTSATFVPIRAGMESSRMFVPRKEDTDTRSTHGVLIIVGSHVPKTTQQLTWLLENGNYRTIEVNVSEVLHTEGTWEQSNRISKQTDDWLANGEDVVIYTSRRLEAGSDSKSSLMINALVSDFLVRVLQGVQVRPKFIVAKGGITSSDLASRGLSAEKALVLGPVIPGVPVWQMDASSKFPGIIYVVFPGNVGDETALLEVCQKLEG